MALCCSNNVVIEVVCLCYFGAAVRALPKSRGTVALRRNSYDIAARCCFRRQSRETPQLGTNCNPRGEELRHPVHEGPSQPSLPRPAPADSSSSPTTAPPSTRYETSDFHPARKVACAAWKRGSSPFVFGCCFLQCTQMRKGNNVVPAVPGGIPPRS